MIMVNTSHAYMACSAVGLLVNAEHVSLLALDANVFVFRFCQTNAPLHDLLISSVDVTSWTAWAETRDAEQKGRIRRRNNDCRSTGTRCIIAIATVIAIAISIVIVIVIKAVRLIRLQMCLLL